MQNGTTDCGNHHHYDRGECCGHSPCLYPLAPARTAGYAISYAGSQADGYEPRLALPGNDRWHNFRDASGASSRYAAPAEAIARAGETLCHILNASPPPAQLPENKGASPVQSPAAMALVEQIARMACSNDTYGRGNDAPNYQHDAGDAIDALDYIIGRARKICGVAEHRVWEE